MRVLIVDDDPLVLESCERVLKSEGISVTTVESAALARPRLAGGIYDVLLADIKMPSEDGFSLVSWMKKNSTKTVCVMMSGYATYETMKESRSCGARCFLPKPFTPDELIKAIRCAVTEEDNVEGQANSGNR